MLTLKIYTSYFSFLPTISSNALHPSPLPAILFFPFSDFSNSPSVLTNYSPKHFTATITHFLFLFQFSPFSLDFTRLATMNFNLIISFPLSSPFFLINSFFVVFRLLTTLNLSPHSFMPAPLIFRPLFSLPSHCAFSFSSSQFPYFPVLLHQLVQQPFFFSFLFLFFIFQTQGREGTRAVEWKTVLTTWLREVKSTGLLAYEVLGLCKISRRLFGCSLLTDLLHWTQGTSDPTLSEVK